MGVPTPYSNKKNNSFSIFLTIIFSSVSSHFIPTLALGDVDTSGNNTTNSRSTPPPDIATAAVPSPPPAPFRPSIAIIIAVLTAMFSITFLLLLYAKHCKRGNNNASAVHGPSSGVHSGGRKNSGIDRVVVESLPIFRFGSLMGQKEGLECAVCLNRFEPTEVLRLLPKCKHAFHVECVDMWLDGHSTCPLCRYRVDPEDVLLIVDHDYNPQTAASLLGVDPDNVDLESGVGFRRVSGRHSSAGERERERERGFSIRRSLDGFGWKKKNANGNASGGNDSVAVGYFDRYQRKDGMLLTPRAGGGNNVKEQGEEAEAPADVEGRESRDNVTRLEHRISVVSCSGERWSDVQPSDLLYLRSEMIIPRRSRGSRPPRSSSGGSSRGRSVINGRSVSEITGMSRFSGRGERKIRSGININGRHRQRGQEEEEEASGLAPSASAAANSHSLPAVGWGGGTNNNNNNNNDNTSSPCYSCSSSSSASKDDDIAVIADPTTPTL